MPGKRVKRPTRRKQSSARGLQFTIPFIQRCVIVDHHRLVTLPNVKALAIGLKHVKGRPRRILSVTAFVDRKPALRAIPQGDRLPKEVAVLVPSKGGTYRRRLLKTDVVVIENAALHSSNVWMDPVRPGAGIGGRAGEFGTLGCFVLDAAGDRTFMLTCGHVVVDDGQVTQPGGFGTPPPTHVIGRVARRIETPFDVPQCIDVAAIDLRNSRGFRAEPTVCAEPRVSAVAPPGSVTVGMPVFKCGAATDRTGGTITHYSIFPIPGQGNLNGVLVIGGSPGIAAPGDSGAVWRDADGRAVGLHCAGTTNGWAAAVPFALALRAIGARIPPKSQQAVLEGLLGGNG